MTTRSLNRLVAIEARRCRANVLAGGDPEFWRRRLARWLAELDSVRSEIQQAIDTLPGDITGERDPL